MVPLSASMSMMSPSRRSADRAADRRLRADMADAEAARRAGEAAVGDERDLVAHALAVERRRGGEHLAHAGAAARALVADDEHLAFLVVACLRRPSKHASSPSKQRAGPVKTSGRCMPATFTIAPSGARLPFRPTTPPVGVIGLSAGRTTSWSSGSTPRSARFSAIVCR